MPTHFHFSFGFGNYFGFKFRYGTRESPCSRSVIRSGLYDAEFARRSGIIIHEAKTRPKPKDQAKCPLFAVIPVEIRHMIYAQLLTTPSVIDQAHKQLGSRESAMLDQYVPIPNIDATILRVCRLIYVEALPTLYGLNVFKFSSAQSIRHFQNHGLSTYPLVFNFQPAPTGRLHMIRSVILELKSDYRPFNRNGNIGYARDNIWRDWSLSLFNEDRDLVLPWGGSGGSGFPTLEKLTLDFTEWQLTEADGLLVKPFVKKLGGSSGLHELTLKGVKHQGTLDQFKAGLLRDGGVFKVENQ